jgi:hypothetical protein
MESIIQKDKTKCFLCKKNAGGDFLAKHHCFGGALRGKSEKYGLTVYLHNNECHIFGENAVHRNAKIDRMLKAHAQMKAMERYKWTTEDFIKEFYKNYL